VVIHVLSCVHYYFSIFLSKLIMLLNIVNTYFHPFCIFQPLVSQPQKTTNNRSPKTDRCSTMLHSCSMASRSMSCFAAHLISCHLSLSLAKQVSIHTVSCSRDRCTAQYSALFLSLRSPIHVFHVISSLLCVLSFQVEALSLSLSM
jgi:hypothetical protein